MHTPTRRTPRLLVCLCLVLFAASAAACSDDDDAENQEQDPDAGLYDDADQGTDTDTGGEPDANQEEPEGPSFCEATSWECSEFVDGPDLSVRRHGHDTVLLHDGRVLLLGGSERIDGGPASGSSNTWEIFDPEENEVAASGELPDVRRSTAIVQLDNGSVLAVGGRDQNNTQVPTVQHFDPERQEWSSIAHMGAPFRRAVTLDDGRVLAAGASHSSDRNARIVGQVLEPAQDSWSTIEAFETAHEEITNLVFKQTATGDIVAMYTHDVPPPDGAPPGIDFFGVTAVTFDFETGAGEELKSFERIAPGMQSAITLLPQMGQALLQIRSFDEDGVEEEALGYLFDPESNELTEKYERDPAPGQVRSLLPGDELIFVGSSQVQLYDVPTDTWRNFTMLPEGIYYTSMQVLPDCRLFVSGERTLNLSDAELRGVDSGYCMPVDDGE